MIVTTSRWVVILATVLVAGGVAWLLRLTVIAVLVVTGAPENHERIVELNRSGRAPEGDLTQLEAGTNRCAAG